MHIASPWLAEPAAQTPPMMWDWSAMRAFIFLPIATIQPGKTQGLAEHRRSEVH